jgi:hypothetical protein
MSSPVYQDFHQGIAHGGGGKHSRQDMRLSMLPPDAWQQGQPWACGQHYRYPSAAGLKTAGMPADEQHDQ